jgi:hypothetical protein
MPDFNELEKESKKKYPGRWIAANGIRARYDKGIRGEDLIKPPESRSSAARRSKKKNRKETTIILRGTVIN